MALSDLSFGLYTDDELTTPFTGLFQLTHQTDLSDNPQDFQLWFGSTVSGRQLQANSNPGVDNITITPTDTLANWEAATAYSLGYMIEPSTPNGFVYRATVGGTSHASVEPTWPTTGIGSTVTDGTVTWALVGAKHPITEIKLALDAGDLGSATPGAALNLGTTIDSGDANAVEINIRITNTVTTVYSDTGYPQMGIFINEVIETEAP